MGALNGRVIGQRLIGEGMEGISRGDNIPQHWPREMEGNYEQPRTRLTGVSAEI
jgi:hypothetical protein